jgi:hypothetical protein
MRFSLVSVISVIHAMLTPIASDRVSPYIGNSRRAVPLSSIVARNGRRNLRRMRYMAGSIIVESTNGHVIDIATNQ